MDPRPLVEQIPYLSNTHVLVDCLRLDQIHPIVSGNKWYKLRFYLQAAIKANAKTIASFGGPYSNHLVALAFAAKEAGLKSIGYVRSNQGEPITPSMEEALQYGMEIQYLGRTHFWEKKNTLLTAYNPIHEIYYVDEGGYGKLGALGAATILSDKFTSNENPLYSYQSIICAVGTGTMMAGIVNASHTNQKIIGIPVLKNEGSIQNEIQALLLNPKAKFELLHEFHQGGYAKTTPIQINFMNAFWDATNIPTDIVYTGKVFYAVQQLVNKNFFEPNSRVLVIHSGGLQGNRSLAQGKLNY